MSSLFKPLIGDAVPDAVVQPETETELIELVRWVAANMVPMTPRGKASSGYGGVIPVKKGPICFLVQALFAFCEEVRNTKSEFRISKQIQNSNLSMTETIGIGIVSNFGFGSFEFVSDFGFRYSDLVAAEGRLRDFDLVLPLDPIVCNLCLFCKGVHRSAGGPC